MHEMRGLRRAGGGRQHEGAALQPLPRHRAPARTVHPGDRLRRRVDSCRQLLRAETVNGPAAFGELTVPVQERPGLLRPRGFVLHGREGNPVLAHRAPRLPGRARRACGFEKAAAPIARIDHHTPQFALFDVAQDPRRAGILELALGMFLAQPAAEFAHARRGPDLMAGVAVASLDGIEQRRCQLGVRRQDGLAGRGGRHQAGVRPRRRSMRLEQFFDPREYRRENLRLR